MTLFSCIWIALHPNIPGPDDSRLRIFLRRVELMVLALIAPEFVVLWAMRQWLVSRRLTEKYRALGHRWTRSHGFLAVMGGFMLYEGGKASRILQGDELEFLSNSGAIIFPDITEKQIKDRSKGDGLTKTIVVIQTSWFILQCIARRVEHLPVTELEIATVAFAILNFATYWLWWDKPLNVRCAVQCGPPLGT